MADTAQKTSPADMQRIFEDARKFSAQYAGFIKAAEVMGSLGSIEQAVAEAQQRLKAARDAEEKAAHDSMAAGAARQLYHDGEMKRFEAELAAKRREAEQMGAAARAEERSIIDNAHRAAENIKMDVNQSVMAVAADVQSHRNKLQETEADIADRQIELVELDRQAQQKRAKLQEIADEHARFLAKIGAH